MTIEQLQQILDYALQQACDGCQILDDTTGHGYNSIEYEQAQIAELNAIREHFNEVQSLYEVYGMRKIFDDKVFLTTANDVMDTINIRLYNVYGGMYRNNNNTTVTFKSFLAEVRNNGHLQSEGMEQYTDDMLEMGYEVIADLFLDNEIERNNDDNGHYIK